MREVGALASLQDGENFIERSGIAVGRFGGFRIMAGIDVGMLPDSDQLFGDFSTARSL
jgi:hypothetical protein